MENYRDIPADKILKFKHTPSFKGWRHFFTEDSVTHPAKMNLNLLRWILSNYTEKNNVVLDPMAGTGSTTILAAAMGRHGIAVEYESKFCKLIEENIWRTHNHGTFTPKGKMACIHGDARELGRYLIESDVIISSPPYGNRLSDVAIHDGDPARMGYRQTVDVVLTSPPYEGTTLDGKSIEAQERRLKDAGHNPSDFLGGRARNSTLKRYDEVDAIVTSPPYGEAQSGGGIATKGYQGPKHTPTDLVGERSYVPRKFENEDNISCLKYGDIDTVITSPPYEKTESMQDKEWFKEHREEFGGGGIPGEYAPSDDNIGNLKGETYLKAMHKVYQECHNVLKGHGLMVLVVKNFIRDRQVIRLDLDTIKLCESVGFTLLDRWYFELPTKSFWKILYHRKYPDVHEVKYEDILIFEKQDVLVPPKSLNGDSR